MMSPHPTDERLADILDGSGDAEARAHVATCERCTSRVGDAQETVRLAAEAEVPEPPPLYWEAFRRQVGRRIGIGVGDDAPGARSWRAWAVALVATAAAILAATFLPPPSGPAREPALRIPAWAALAGSEEEDVGFLVLLALGPTDEDLGPVVMHQGVAQDIVDLSEEDGQALAEVLEGEWGGNL